MKLDDKFLADIKPDQHGIERTIRSMAKELAAAFYEQNARSARFRAAFPSLQSYMRGQWHQPDGSIKIYRPGWLHHVELARKMLANMLGLSSVNERLKERIYDAIIEDRNRSHARNARQLKQVTNVEAQSN